MSATIVRADVERKLLVMVLAELGRDGDANAVEDLAHQAMRKAVMGQRRSRPSDALMAESFIAPIDYEDGSVLVREGSWVVVVVVKDAAIVCRAARRQSSRAAA